jgi:hypothetical protein
MQASIKQVKEADQPDEDRRMQCYQSMFVRHLGGTVDLRRRSRASSARRSLGATVLPGRASNAEGLQTAPSAPANRSNAAPNAFLNEHDDGPGASSNPPVACELSAAALSEVPLASQARAGPAQEQSVAMARVEGELDTSAPAGQGTIDLEQIVAMAHAGDELDTRATAAQWSIDLAQPPASDICDASFVAPGGVPAHASVPSTDPQRTRSVHDAPTAGMKTEQDMGNLNNELPEVPNETSQLLSSAEAPLCSAPQFSTPATPGSVPCLAHQSSTPTSGSSTPRRVAKSHAVSFMPALLLMSPQGSDQTSLFDTPLTPGREVPLAQRLALESPATSACDKTTAERPPLGGNPGSIAALAPPCMHDSRAVPAPIFDEAPPCATCNVKCKAGRCAQIATVLPEICSWSLMASLCTVGTLPDAQVVYLIAGCFFATSRS